MSKTTVRHVIGINGNTLVVFIVTKHYWQLGLISPGGAARAERRIYYTAEVALKAELK